MIEHLYKLYILYISEKHIPEPTGYIEATKDKLSLKPVLEVCRGCTRVLEGFTGMAYIPEEVRRRLSAYGIYYSSQYPKRKTVVMG